MKNSEGENVAKISGSAVDKELMQIEDLTSGAGAFSPNVPPPTYLSHLCHTYFTHKCTGKIVQEYSNCFEYTEKVELFQHYILLLCVQHPSYLWKYMSRSIIEPQLHWQTIIRSRRSPKVLAILVLWRFKLS